MYLIGTQPVEFVDFKERRLLVSNHCVQNQKPGRCDAIREMKKARFKRSELAGFGGAHPGGQICQMQLGGEIVVGKNQVSKNENSFCRFKDGSLIDTGSLLNRAIKNSKASKS